VDIQFGFSTSNDEEELEHKELQSAPHDPQNGKQNVSAFILGLPIALFEIGSSLE